MCFNPISIIERWFLIDYAVVPLLRQGLQGNWTLSIVLGIPTNPPKYTYTVIFVPQHLVHFHHVLTPHYFYTLKLFSSINIKPSNYSEHLWYFLTTPLWQFASFLSQSYSYFLKLYNLHNKICTIDHLWYILRSTFRFFFYPTHLKTNNAWAK